MKTLIKFITEKNIKVENNSSELLETIEKWVTEEFSDVLQEWLCEEFATTIEEWVLEEFAPTVQKWIVKNFIKKTPFKIEDLEKFLKEEKRLLTEKKQ